MTKPKWFNMRITDEEKKQWRDKADMLGLKSVAELIRYAVKRIRKRS